MNKFENLNFLIVEDDELCTHRLKGIIEKFCKNITTSESAENGSHFVTELLPSIIFLDNNLPRLNGIDVIELYKEISPKSKVILMSSYMEMDEIEEAIQNKADYIIDKENFNENELMTLLNSSFLSEKKNSSLWKLLKVFVQKSVRKINIAVVEDDELFSTHLCHSIKEICTNANVTSYQTGASFVDVLENNKPDLVFLDYYLQDSTGIEILRKIAEFSPESKVIIISSLDDTKKARDLVNQGVDGYIVKNDEWKLNLVECLNELGLN